MHNKQDVAQGRILDRNELRELLRKTVEQELGSNVDLSDINTYKPLDEAGKILIRPRASISVGDEYAWEYLLKDVYWGIAKQASFGFVNKRGPWVFFIRGSRGDGVVYGKYMHLVIEQEYGEIRVGDFTTVVG